MRNLFHILLITIACSSILATELGVFDTIASAFQIELLELSEEGTGEKDGNENSSEKEFSSEYYIDTFQNVISMSIASLSAMHCYETSTKELYIDIPLPPPERV